MNGGSIRLITIRLLKAALFIFVLCPVLPLHAEEIRIGGTGGALGVMKRLAAEYKRSHPAAEFRVLPSLGSSGGIKALTAGALDLAVSAVPPGDKASGLVFRELGRTPFVFATAKAGRLPGISLKEVEDLYAGRISTWQNGSRCRVVLRPATEYDNTLLKSLSPGMERAIADALAREGMVIGVTDQENADLIETVPGAIGTITLGQLLAEQRKLKPLPLNGIRPGLDTLANGSYPYFKKYYIVLKAASSAAVRSFLDFVRSDAGKNILAGTGYQVEDR